MAATVGDAIEVYWPDDKEYYPGKVSAHDPKTGYFTVNYDDGEVEFLNLAYEQWRFLGRATPATSLVSLPPVLYDSSISRSCVTSPTKSINSSPSDSKSYSMNLVEKAEARDMSTCYVVRSSKLASISKPLDSATSPSRRSPRKTVARSHYNKNLHTSLPAKISKRRRSIIKKVSPLKPAPIQDTPRISYAAVQLIEVCVDSWLRNENRREFSMFSAYQCFSNTLSMLTSAIVDLKFHAELMRKISCNGSWILADGKIEKISTSKNYSRWNQPLSKSEWENERLMLLRISKLVREAAMSEFISENGKTNEKPIIGALRLVLHARNRLRNL